MEDFVTRSQQDDQGGRRCLKDRRFQVAFAPGEDKRTNWKRRSGRDQRIRYHEKKIIADKEKPNVP